MSQIATTRDRNRIHSRDQESRKHTRRTETGGSAESTNPPTMERSRSFWVKLSGAVTHSAGLQNRA